MSKSEYLEIRDVIIDSPLLRRLEARVLGRVGAESDEGLLQLVRLVLQLVHLPLQLQRQQRHQRHNVYSHDFKKLHHFIFMKVG